MVLTYCLQPVPSCDPSAANKNKNQRILGFPNSLFTLGHHYATLSLPINCLCVTTQMLGKTFHFKHLSHPCTPFFCDATNFHYSETSCHGDKLSHVLLLFPFLSCCLRLQEMKQKTRWRDESLTCGHEEQGQFCMSHFAPFTHFPPLTSAQLAKHMNIKTPE